MQVDAVAVLDHELTVAKRHDPDLLAERGTGRGVAHRTPTAVVVWQHQYVREAQARELELQRRRKRGGQRTGSSVGPATIAPAL